MRGTSNSQDAQAYDAAKAFIATQAKDSFTDESAQNQQIFTAKNGDFYKPEVYSQYANNKDYRGYFWAVQGLNLKPDNPTPQEPATYVQRQPTARAGAAMRTKGRKGLPERLRLWPKPPLQPAGRPRPARAPSPRTSRSSVRPCRSSAARMLIVTSSIEKHGPTRARTRCSGNAASSTHAINTR